MTHQLLEKRCAGTDQGTVRPRQMLHVLFDGPDGRTGWLVRLTPRNVLERLHPARTRIRLAAINPAEFADALDSLAAGEPAQLRRLGYSVTRTE
jgi:hypothetical protein